METIVCYLLFLCSAKDVVDSSVLHNAWWYIFFFIVLLLCGRLSKKIDYWDVPDTSSLSRDDDVRALFLSAIVLGAFAGYIPFLARFSVLFYIILVLCYFYNVYQIYQYYPINEVVYIALMLLFIVPVSYRISYLIFYSSGWFMGFLAFIPLGIVTAFSMVDDREYGTSSSDYYMGDADYGGGGGSNSGSGGSYSNSTGSSSRYGRTYEYYNCKYYNRSTGECMNHSRYETGRECSYKYKSVMGCSSFTLK